MVEFLSGEFLTGNFSNALFEPGSERQPFEAALSLLEYHVIKIKCRLRASHLPASISNAICSVSGACGNHELVNTGTFEKKTKTFKTQCFQNLARLAKPKSASTSPNTMEDVWNSSIGQCDPQYVLVPREMMNQPVSNQKQQSNGDQMNQSDGDQINQSDLYASSVLADHQQDPSASLIGQSPAEEDDSRPENGNETSVTEGQPSTMYREQDLYLPITNISRIMKNCLPENGKTSKTAKTTVQECVSEFISFITSEAAETVRAERRQTLNGDDLINAMERLGFQTTSSNYIDPLRVYLKKYRQMNSASTVCPDDSDDGGKQPGD